MNVKKKFLVLLIAVVLCSSCAGSADDTSTKREREGVYVYTLSSGHNFLGVAQDRGTPIYGGAKYAYSGRWVTFQRADGSTLEVFFSPGAPLVFTSEKLPFTGEPWIH